MPSCRNCGTEVGDSYNFCPTCATPQNDEARRRLDEFIDQRARQQSGGNASISGDLRSRVQYAIGYVAIVAGLMTLTAGAGLFFLLAGLVVLPPVQTALESVIESQLGRQFGHRPTAAAAGALFVVGAATFVIV
jgi:hypothetical protein